MRKDLSSSLLPQDSLLKDALDTLNRGAFGVVFFEDKEKRVVGVMTDGDMRRAFLKGAKLESPVGDYVKRNFVSGKSSAPHEKNIRLLSDEIHHLPILDENGRLVDFLSWSDIWRLPVMEPTLGGNEMKYVVDCIATNWISSQGSYVKTFEKSFSSFLSMDYALTTSNGTCALHLALLALEIGPGDEVIVPDLTFAASANAVIHAGAKPVLVDVSGKHWGMDPGCVEAAITRKTKAIMPVHLYGHPCEMEPLIKLAKTHRLSIVEDCAEALGAQYKGRKVGTFGDISCFSFFSNKVITTGEGGMVVTNHEKLNHKMAILRDHGMSRSRRYWHETVGFNYRMTNLQAAVGLAQLEQIDRFLKNRRQIAGIYAAQLKDIKGITLPPEMPWAQNIY